LGKGVWIPLSEQHSSHSNQAQGSDQTYAEAREAAAAGDDSRLVEIYARARRALEEREGVARAAGQPHEHHSNHSSAAPPPPPPQQQHQQHTPPPHPRPPSAARVTAKRPSSASAVRERAAERKRPASASVTRPRVSAWLNPRPSSATEAQSAWDQSNQPPPVTVVPTGSATSVVRVAHSYGGASSGASAGGLSGAGGVEAIIMQQLQEEVLFLRRNNDALQAELEQRNYEWLQEKARLVRISEQAAAETAAAERLCQDSLASLDAREAENAELRSQVSRLISLLNTTVASQSPRPMSESASSPYPISQDRWEHTQVRTEHIIFDQRHHPHPHQNPQNSLSLSPTAPEVSSPRKKRPQTAGAMSKPAPISVDPGSGPESGSGGFFGGGGGGGGGGGKGVTFIEISDPKSPSSKQVDPIDAKLEVMSATMFGDAMPDLWSIVEPESSKKKADPIDAKLDVMGAAMYGEASQDLWAIAAPAGSKKADPIDAKLELMSATMFGDAMPDLWVIAEPSGPKKADPIDTKLEVMSATMFGDAMPDLWSIVEPESSKKKADPIDAKLDVMGAAMYGEASQDLWAIAAPAGSKKADPIDAKLELMSATMFGDAMPDLWVIAEPSGPKKADPIDAKLEVMSATMFGDAMNPLPLPMPTQTAPSTPAPSGKHNLSVAEQSFNISASEGEMEQLLTSDDEDIAEIVRGGNVQVTVRRTEVTADPELEKLLRSTQTEEDLNDLLRASERDLLDWEKRRQAKVQQFASGDKKTTGGVEISVPSKSTPVKLGEGAPLASESLRDLLTDDDADVITGVMFGKASHDLFAEAMGPSGDGAGDVGALVERDLGVMSAVMFGERMDDLFVPPAEAEAEARSARAGKGSAVGGSRGSATMPPVNFDVMDTIIFGDRSYDLLAV
jgi:hypothetical protein